MVNSNVLADYDRLREIALSEYSGNPDDDSLPGCVSQITCGGFFNQKIVDSYPASALRYPDIFQTFLFHLGLLTVTGSRAGCPVLGIPNLNVRIMCWDYMQKFAGDILAHEDLAEISRAFERAAFEGDFMGLLETVTGKCAEACSNRQLVNREGLLQSFFLALST